MCIATVLDRKCVCVCRLQEEKMAVVEGMLRQRETERQTLSDRRLELLWSVLKSLCA